MPSHSVAAQGRRPEFTAVTDPMDSAVSAARWVVGKALGPVTDGLVEAWAASSELGPNISDLKMELLYAQGMLDNAQAGREVRSPALKLLLQELWQLAFNAEDVLDELDYFRIQDEIYNTYEAADEHAKGCLHNLFLNATHTCKFAVKIGTSFCSRDANTGRATTEDEVELGEREAMQRVHCCAWPGASSRSQRARDTNSPAPANGKRLSTIYRSVGKHLSCCCSFATVQSDTEVGKMVPPRVESVLESPKMEFYRVDMSKRMKDIVVKLKPLCAKVSTILNLELLDSNRSIAQSIAANIGVVLNKEERRALPPVETAKSPPITTSEILDPNFVGRETEKDRIITEIIQDESCRKDLTVIPIVGLGGIGKTTLARHIYKEVEKLFDVMIWVCVPLKFSVDSLIKEIAKSFPDVNKESNPHKKIEQGLKHKKFFIVLDDMWDCDNDWNMLLEAFPKEQTKGNIILVTSRIPIVAEMVKTTDDAIELDGLNEDAFWQLFIACVFGNKKSNYQIDDQLHEIGKEIIKKLHGNPLAAQTVGKILSGHLDPDHWRRVLESKEWTLQTGDDDIMPALKLTYDFLPFHLQQCFSYCALFPEDHMFDAKELIYFWIGLDILQSDGQNESIKDIAERSFNDLVTRGFFKEGQKYGQTCYLMHDLLRDLALKVASHECLSVDSFNVASVQIRQSTRHLSIIIDGKDNTDGIAGENFRAGLRELQKRLTIGNLQSLIFFGDLDGSFVKICGEFLSKASGLRVLRLPIISWAMESILHSLPTLKHLRYLRLENHDIYEISLPKILSRFYHLRVLDLQDWYGSTDLPDDVSNLRKLVHFLAAYDKLHSNISNVGELQFLQELKNFQVNKDNNGFEQKQLGKLFELRELVVHKLEEINTKEEAVEAKLKEKKYLKGLTLVWGGEKSNIKPEVQSMVLESLQPHMNLQRLCIKGHGGSSYPIWLGDKQCVKAVESLCLVDVAWNSLPPLGQMKLVELTLEDIDSINEFVLWESFGSLKKVTLSGLRNFTNWVTWDSEHVFTKLQTLIIKDCEELLGLPLFDSICYPSEKNGNKPWLPNLREFEVVGCKNIQSLPPIPWTRSLCSVKIENVGPEKPGKLKYSKSSSVVNLSITGKDCPFRIGEVLVFDNLKDLQKLEMEECSPLELEHMKMLTSLKTLKISNSNRGLVSLAGSHGDDNWQSLVERLWISKCDVSGQKFTQLLHHLPRLSELEISECKKTTWLGVAAQDATRPAQGLLLFPAHLSSSLRSLRINNCQQFVVGRGGGGLQALSSLQKLHINNCPSILQDYRKSCPFPSSLQYLSLSKIWVFETLELLSNLTSLTVLYMQHCGGQLSLMNLWPLLTQGQLRELTVHRIKDFFVGWDGEGQQQQHLPSSCTL
uniref:NB-ARC domain-containing protein n=1 Tax=Leersia perrieri TaxID=77586 RepID=A0A0D9W9U3_9ORYZ